MQRPRLHYTIGRPTAALMLGRVFYGAVAQIFIAWVNGSSPERFEEMKSASDAAKVGPLSSHLNALAMNTGIEVVDIAFQEEDVHESTEMAFS
jgi:hypothetical protein